MGGGGTSGSSAGKTRFSSSDPIFNSFSSPGARRRPSASSDMEGGAEAERRVASPGPGRPATRGRGILGAVCLCPRRATGREAPPARHAEMLAETWGICSGASLAVSLEETRAVHARAGDLCLGCAPRSPPRRRAPACVAQTLLTTFSGLALFPLLLPFLRFFILTIPPRTTSPSHFPYATPLPAPSTSSKSPTFSLSRPLS